MSFLSKLCNDNESRVQDSADVPVGSLSDADLREAVRSVLGDTYRLVNIVRHDGDIELQLESERDGTVYQYSYFEPGHMLVDDFKRELSATRLRPVSSYKKKVGDSKVRGRAQDSEGDFYSKKVWGADDSDIARVVRESNPILEHIGWGTNAKRSVDFRVMGDDEVAYVEIPVVAGMTLGDLRDALDPNNLPFPGIVEDSKVRRRTCDSRDGWEFSDSDSSGKGRGPFYYTKSSSAGKPISQMTVLSAKQGDGVVNFILTDDLQGYLPVDTISALDSVGFVNLKDAQELAEFIMESSNAFHLNIDTKLREFDTVSARVSDSAGHRCKKCDEGKLSENRRRVSDSDDLSGWERDYSRYSREPIYVKDYGDNVPRMAIVDFTKFGGPAEFRIHTRLLKNLGFDELADILYFTKFDSFSKAADVVDRIAEAHSAYYKSLSDIIEQ